MKYLFLLFPMMCILISSAGKDADAQELNLNFSDGTYSKISIADIESIRFDSDQLIINTGSCNNLFYSILYTDMLCIAESSTAYPDLSGNAGVQIFPNPVKDVLYLKLQQNSNTEALIYNMQGSLLVKQQIHNLLSEIDIHHLNPGIYILTIGAETLKFVKQ